MPQSSPPVASAQTPSPASKGVKDNANRIFRDVLTSTPAIEGLILLNFQGQVVSMAGPNEEALGRLAPFGVGILDLVDRLATDSGRGQLEYNLMRAEGGYVLLHQVDQDHVLFALADSDATLGVLLHDVGWCADRLARHL